MSSTTTRCATLMALGLGTLLLAGARTAWSQTSDAQFFACGEVRFFAQACPPLPEAPPPAVVPALLFTPETVGPDTPPLLLRLLQEPTVDNARAFVAWQRARYTRISEVQDLVRTLSRPERRP